MKLWNYEGFSSFEPKCFEIGIFRSLFEAGKLLDPVFSFNVPLTCP